MHRSSLKATPTTGRVDITDEDRRAILEPLTRYGHIDTVHFECFGKRHYTTTRSRLKKFFHETADWKLADKPILRNVSAHAKAFSEPIYYHRGPSIYADLNYDDQTKKLLESTIIGPHFNEHDISLCRCVAEIEQAVTKAGLEFISHYEIVKRSKRVSKDRPLHVPVPKIEHTFKSGTKTLTNIDVRPDAVFGIRYPGNKTRFFAVERDRGNETFIPTHGFDQTSWLQKVLSYRAALWQELGISKIYILAIMETERRADNLINTFKEPSLYALPVKSTYKPDNFYFTATWKGQTPLKLGEV